jgi:nicotinate-nucleotide pyrophosphorylase (carboxylating)
VIRDTRKTTPGLRALEKYAVRCGGGENHRMSLSDGVLIKDNHIAAAGGVAEAYSLVRQHVRDQPIEIEVDSLEQLRIAMASGADVVLLDNMSPDLLKDAVRIGRQYEAATGGSILFEASGGLTLSTVRAVAESGVNFIAVGALTHSSQVLDIGLDFQILE